MLAAYSISTWWLLCLTITSKLTYLLRLPRYTIHTLVQQDGDVLMEIGDTDFDNELHTFERHFDDYASP